MKILPVNGEEEEKSSQQAIIHHIRAKYGGQEMEETRRFSEHKGASNIPFTHEKPSQI